jgi:hypothetical protein
MRLLLISIASLYFELLLIRWLPTQIRVLAYFNNIILISCILGLGLGALVSGRVPLKSSLVFLLLSGLMMLAVLYHGLDVKLPLTSGDYFLWNGLSRSAKGTVWQYVALFVFFATNTALMVPIGQVLGIEFDRLPPLRAYLINVAGAMVGLTVFALFSLYGTTPFWWFVSGLGLLLPLLPMDRVSALGAGLACVVTVSTYTVDEDFTAYGLLDHRHRLHHGHPGQRRAHRRGAPAPHRRPASRGE